MTSNKGKTYIPDTNIAIDDTYFLRDFLKDKENKVVLPDVVISEINGLKKHPEVGYEARAFTDYLFMLLKDAKNINSGISVPLSSDGKICGGKLFFTNVYDTKKGNKEILKYNTDIGFNDLQIIRAAAVRKKNHSNEDVILVSNDKNVINVATLNGIKAEYLRKDSADPSKLNKGYRTWRPNQKLLRNIIDKGSKFHVSELDQEFTKDLIANEYVVLITDAVQKAIDESYKYNITHTKKVFRIEPKFIKRYDILSDSLVDIAYRNTPIGGFSPMNLEQLLLIDQLLNDKIRIKVACAGPGTGKSFLELLVALHKTMQRRKAGKSDAKVYVIRRSTFIEDYGFMPGDIIDKNIHTYEGVAENYRQIMELLGGGTKKNNYAPLLADALKEYKGLIELLPFGTIRGVTISPNSTVIGEEWQNTEIKFSKLMMDRNSYGEVYLNGDTEQKDNPHTSLERNGLIYMANRIQEISRNARITKDELDMYDASIAGVMSLGHPERGPINLWSKRNLSSSAGR